MGSHLEVGAATAAMLVMLGALTMSFLAAFLGVGLFVMTALAWASRFRRFDQITSENIAILYTIFVMAGLVFGVVSTFDLDVISLPLSLLGLGFCLMSLRCMAIVLEAGKA